ncbi:MAG: hypothetical protein RIC16_02060 [Rhodospirillales bacterium]
MATSTDIYRTANLLIETYGEMAAVGAAIKADECLRNGNATGRAVWLRIVRAVEELTEEQPPAGVTIN